MLGIHLGESCDRRGAAASRALETRPMQTVVFSHHHQTKLTCGTWYFRLYVSPRSCIRPAPHSAVTNGNYRRLQSQFLQTSPSNVPTFLASAEAKCYVRNGIDKTGDSQRRRSMAPRRHAIWTERRRSGPEADSRSHEGLALLLRLGKRWRVAGGCLHTCSIGRYGAHPTAPLAL